MGKEVLIMKATSKKIKEMLTGRRPVDFENIDEPREELAAAPSTATESLYDVVHAEPGALQAIKSSAKGHGEQLILPDDCEFGDNELCYVEA
jgi:hypothetical protein